MALPPPNRPKMAAKPHRQRPARRGARVPQLRLLPVMIFVAMTMLIVRVNDIWTSVATLDLPHVGINQSQAQQPPQPGGKVKDAPQPSLPVGKPPAGAAPAPTPVASSGLSGAMAPAGDPNAPAAVPGGQAVEGEPPIFTQNEVDVLEKLSARRQALDSREQDIAGREELLKAAEQRIDKKIAEMKALQSDVEGMLAKIDEQDEAKLKSLVKIYEDMKSKDAARIFEQLDKQTLLDVVENMKEQKVAEIMGQMDPIKAKDLTTAIHARRAAKIEGQTAAAPADAGGSGQPPAAKAPAGPQNQPGG